LDPIILGVLVTFSIRLWKWKKIGIPIPRDPALELFGSFVFVFFLVIPFVSILSITVVLWNEFGIIIAALGIPLALLNQWVVRRLMIAVILRSFRALFGAEPPPSAFSSASTT
jgi:hypothetical protein